MTEIPTSQRLILLNAVGRVSGFLIGRKSHSTDGRDVHSEMRQKHQLSSRKTEMIAWLEKHNIPYNKDLLKPKTLSDHTTKQGRKEAYC